MRTVQMPPDGGTWRVLADESLFEVLGRTVGEPGYLIAEAEEKSRHVRRDFQAPGARGWAIVIVVSKGDNPSAGLHPPELVRSEVERCKLGHQRGFLGTIDDV